MFLRDGEAGARAEPDGAAGGGDSAALSGVRPGCDGSGKLPLKDLLLPAAKIAEEGFPIDRVYAGKLSASRRRRSTSSPAAATRAAEVRRQRLRRRRHSQAARPRDVPTGRMAEEGTDWFYGGPFADKVARWMADNGGIITEADFASYLPVEREPLETTYRDWTIVGFPPPSSGGVHVAQMLNMLETFDLKKTYDENPAQALPSDRGGDEAGLRRSGRSGWAIPTRSACRAG